ncbi:hypothetical protein SK128_006923 [Halocaridina rubra]|uniref:Ionotropic glutamate receptor L-glutamate and glycine-binding domain-containing protein n=1 Tax=Halocaridina rubra TaxID=373956 RepID=A0AAN8XEC2_HALRR
MLSSAPGVTLMVPTEKVCCTIRNVINECECITLIIPRELTIGVMGRIVSALKTSGVKNIAGTCGQAPTTPSSTKPFYTAIQAEIDKWPNIEWIADKMQIAPQLEFSITAVNSTVTSEVGTWNTKTRLKLNPNYKHSPIRRFFKVGAVLSRPWLIRKEGGEPGEYEGYCVELTKRLAEYMEFDFEFKFPKDEQYGARQENGSWNGLVGDLANGLTDMIVAPLTMTSEREEVIDFVAPYFDQSGISIGNYL